MVDEQGKTLGLKIALSGRKFSGKDECAKVLKKHFGLETFSFSDQLKAIAHELFPWLQLDYPQDLKEKKIWVSPYDGREWSARDVWVALNVIVEIDPSILVRKCHYTRMRHMMALLDDDKMRHCIKDLRPHNPKELEYCLKHNFVIIYIENCKDPVPEEDLHETEDNFDTIINHASIIFQNYKEGEQPFIDFVKAMGVEPCSEA